MLEKKINIKIEMINQRWQTGQMGRCNMRDEAMIEGEQKKEVAHCLRV